MKNILLAALLLALTGCAGSDYRSAYVKPDGPCGYVVALSTPPSPTDGDVTISKCDTLPKATALADQINKDMGPNWSGGH